MTKIADTIMPSGYTFQQVMLLNALRRQAKSGMLMTNHGLQVTHHLQKRSLLLLMILRHQRLVKNFMST